MAGKSLRLNVGSIFTKEPGKIYFYRYLLDGHRKTVSLQTANRVEAIREAEALCPIVQATSAEVIAAHVSQARGLSSVERNLSLSEVREFYSCHPRHTTPATCEIQLDDGKIFKSSKTMLNVSKLSVGEHSYKVRAIDKDKNIGEWSEVQTFTISRSPARTTPAASRNTS